MMQMAFTAFVMYNCKGAANTRPFQNFSDSNDDINKKHSGGKTK